MGGIKVDYTGQSPHLKGLFACGEAACWDLHGFNRLGGNSVAETVVSGMIIGEYVSKYCNENRLQFDTKIAQRFMKEFDDLQDKILCNLCTPEEKTKGYHNIYDIRDQMKKIMMDDVGIFRNGEDLKEAVAKLKDLLVQSQKVSVRSKTKSANPELIDVLRTKKMLKLALCVAKGALQRTESRGAHTREDYSKRDDLNWLKRTLTYWNNSDDIEPTIEYEDIDISTMEIAPGFRGYGKKGNIIINPESSKREQVINDIKEKNKDLDRFEIQKLLMPFELPKIYQNKNQRVGIDYE
jgi:fumarate reductase flavoprotein subunit